MTVPIPCAYIDGAFRPLQRFEKIAAAAYGEGEIVKLAPVEGRSKKSHDHFFVVVNEAWLNLPESVASRWPTDDHLRKWALIKAGYRDERSIVCASKAEAVRVKAFIRPMDEYGVVLAQGAVVTVYTAKSQSLKAMGAKVFQESKTAVLGVLADLLGVEPATLARQAA
jgi:hypothetical protein